MKHRLLSTLTLLLLTIAAHAAPRQQLAIGLTYNRATEYNQNGFGLKLQIPLSANFALEGEMIYFAQSRKTTTLHLNIHAQYRFQIIDRLCVYPFAGAGYSHWGYDGPNVSRWGANIGGGAEVYLGHGWGILGETRAQLVSHETQIIFTAGLRYHF